MKKLVSIVILGCFFVTSIMGPDPVYAQEFRLPAPGVMVHLSPEFNPPILKGIKVHPDDPFHFDFILDQGDHFSDLKEESTRLIKYFLASLTIPEQDLWVNLSPYEKNRIVPDSFGRTEMGRDLLAEDYMLKQVTASLIYPEDDIGKKFWKRIYEEAAKKFGTTNIPVNTFNKVWIVPEKAVVYENVQAGTAYIVESKLKVMLEQDYLSLQKHFSGVHSAKQLTTSKQVGLLGANIVREIVIPELTKEVNEDKNFAQLRQVYNSLILATWYKKKIKDSILEQVYADKNKVAGVNIDDPQEKEKIYQRYLQAFKKGVFNFIKEEPDPITREVIPRKYFSGGMGFDGAQLARAETFTRDAAVLSNNNPTDLAIISANVKVLPMEPAMKSSEEISQMFNTALAWVANTKRLPMPDIQDPNKLRHFRIVAINKETPLEDYSYSRVLYQPNHPSLGNFVVTGTGEVSFLILDKGEKGAVASFGHNSCFSLSIRAKAGEKNVIGHAHINPEITPYEPNRIDAYWKFQMVLDYIKRQTDWRDVQVAFSESEDMHGFPPGKTLEDLETEVRKMGFGVLPSESRPYQTFTWLDTLTTPEETINRFGPEGGPYQYKIRAWNQAQPAPEVSGNQVISIAQDWPEPVLLRARILERSAEELPRMGPGSSTLNYGNAAFVPWQEVISDAQQSLNDESPRMLAKFGPKENRVALWANNQDVRAGFLELVKDVDSGIFQGDIQGSMADHIAQMHKYLLIGGPLSENSYYLSTMFYRHPSSNKQEDIRRVEKVAGVVLHRQSLSVQTRFEQILSSFRSVLNEIHHRDVHELERFIVSLVHFYRDMMRGDDPHQDFLFVYGNDSLSMNMVNGFLRLNGLNGIVHAQLQSIARWNSLEETVEAFNAMVRQSNPGIDFSKPAAVYQNLQLHEVTPGSSAIKAEEGQGFNWQMLEKEGYSIEEHLDKTRAQAPEVLTVALKKDGQDIKTAFLSFEIFPSQQIIRIQFFWPEFPKDKVGRGRALLRHILAPYKNYHILADNVSDEFRSSLRKMQDYQMEESDVRLGLMAREEFNQILSSDSFRQLSLYQQRWLRNFILDSKIHGRVPGQVTAEVQRNWAMTSMSYGKILTGLTQDLRSRNATWEHYSKAESLKHSLWDEIFDLHLKSYSMYKFVDDRKSKLKKTQGQKGFQDFVSHYDEVFIVRDSKKNIAAFMLAKRTPFGIKINLVGNNGDLSSKVQLLDTLEHLDSPGVYMEISGKLEQYMLSFLEDALADRIEGTEPRQNIAIVNPRLDSILKGDDGINPDIDGMHFERLTHFDQKAVVVRRVFIGRPLLKPRFLQRMGVSSVNVPMEDGFLLSRFYQRVMEQYGVSPKMIYLMFFMILEAGKDSVFKTKAWETKLNTGAIVKKINSDPQQFEGFLDAWRVQVLRGSFIERILSLPDKLKSPDRDTVLETTDMLEVFVGTHLTLAGNRTNDKVFIKLLGESQRLLAVLGARLTDGSLVQEKKSPVPANKDLEQRRELVRWRDFLDFITDINFDTYNYDRNDIPAFELDRSIDHESLALLLGYGQNAQRKYRTLVSILKHKSLIEDIRVLNYEQIHWGRYFSDQHQIEDCQFLVPTREEYGLLRTIVNEPRWLNFFSTLRKKGQIYIKQEMIYLRDLEHKTSDVVATIDFVGRKIVMFNPYADYPDIKDKMNVLLDVMGSHGWKFKLTRLGGGDYAMKPEEPKTGGIDFTAANMNLQTHNAGEGIKFHLDPALLAQLQNAPGFVPVIINIQPMTDLRMFLGINDPVGVDKSA